MTLPPFKTLYLTLAFLVSTAFALPVSQTVRAEESKPWQAWQSKLNLDHPLVGKIYSVKEELEITPDELAVRLMRNQFVLLGEIHDNPDHHRLQAWIISEIAALNRSPAIVMEQIRSDQAGLLKLFQSGKHKTAERMGPAIDWEKSGWPAWSLYQPIAKSALAAGLTFFAGDSTKDMNRDISRKGFEVLEKGEVEKLGLHLPLGSSLDDALLEELVISHCNMMPKKRMGPMALVQRYRDAHLARAMREAGDKDGAILIAGNGHVRNDRAVPWYLRGEQIDSTTLMIVETNREAKTALDLIRLDPNGKPTADYIWVTPRTEREDPCNSLRKQFGKIKKDSPNPHKEK